jgi:hypothetical protein
MYGSASLRKSNNADGGTTEEKSKRSSFHTSIRDHQDFTTQTGLTAAQLVVVIDRNFAKEKDQREWLSRRMLAGEGSRLVTVSQTSSEIQHNLIDLCFNVIFRFLEMFVFLTIGLGRLQRKMNGVVS